MPEIGTSGSMRGRWKRAMKWDLDTGRRRKLTETDYPNLKPPRQRSTLPTTLQLRGYPAAANNQPNWSSDTLRAPLNHLVGAANAEENTPIVSLTDGLLFRRKIRIEGGPNGPYFLFHCDQPVLQIITSDNKTHLTRENAQS
jgi:hypothetical protein